MVTPIDSFRRQWLTGAISWGRRSKNAETARKADTAAAGFVCLVLAFGFAIGWSSRCQPSKAEAKEKGSHSNQYKCEESSFWDWMTHDEAGFFTFWLVVIGFSQAGLFVWQLGFMRATVEAIERQSGIANRALMATHRPKIGIRHLEFDTTRVMSQQAEATLVVVNKGASPAYFRKANGILYFRSTEGITQHAFDEYEGAIEGFLEKALKLKTANRAGLAD